MHVSDDDDRNIAQRHRFGRFGVTASDTCRPAEPRPPVVERTAYHCRPPEQFDAPVNLERRMHETRRLSRSADVVARLVLWLVLVLAIVVCLVPLALPLILEAAP